MSAKNKSALLDKLRTSLPKQAVQPAKPETRPTIKTEAPAPAPASKPAKAAKTPSPTADGTRAPKLSVSLYGMDYRLMDEIKGFMGKQGYRNLGDSEALRLACRGVLIEERLVGIYQQMLAEDGRRKKK